MIDRRDENERVKRMLRTPILHVFFHENVTDHKNYKSVHAGHADSKSCMPESQTMYRARGHALFSGLDICL